MEIKPNSVGAVVVTYNRLELLKQVLDSLLAQTRPVDHIYVVDNASSDGTAEFLAGLGNPKVSSTRMSTNTGGAGGFSYGMKWVFDEGHEWIWMMDDDACPFADCLEVLLEMNRPPSPGLRSQDGVEVGIAPVHTILVPLRITPSGENAEWAAQEINLDRPFVREFRLGWVRSLYPDLSTIPPSISIQDFTFEGPLFHRTVPGKDGFPISDLFISGDDLEYALRIRRRGLDAPVCVTGARLVRLRPSVSIGTAGNDLWRSYYVWRNLLLIQSMYARNLAMVVRPYLLFFASTIKAILTGSTTINELRVRRHAVLDSFRGNLPRRYLPEAQRSADSPPNHSAETNSGKKGVMQ